MRSTRYRAAARSAIAPPRWRPRRSAPAPSAVDLVREVLVAAVPPVALPATGRWYRRDDGVRMVEMRPGEFVSARAYETLTGRPAP
jgi:hypothetical protein